MSPPEELTSVYLDRARAWLASHPEHVIESRPGHLVDNWDRALAWLVDALDEDESVHTAIVSPEVFVQWQLDAVLSRYIVYRGNEATRIEDWLEGRIGRLARAIVYSDMYYRGALRVTKPYEVILVGGHEGREQYVTYTERTGREHSDHLQGS